MKCSEARRIWIEFMSSTPKEALPMRPEFNKAREHIYRCFPCWNYLKQKLIDRVGNNRIVNALFPDHSKP